MMRLRMKARKVHLGQRFDEQRQHPMCRIAVVMQPRSRRPFERVVADEALQELMIFPTLGRHHRRVGEAGLVRHHLQHGDRAFAVAREFRDVLGDTVVEAQQPILDQQPDRCRGDDLGVGIKPARRVDPHRHVAAHAREAEFARESELAVARDGDLRAGITLLGDVLLDQLGEPLERLGTQRRGGKIGCR
jgi:hypothetical protein